MIEIESVAPSTTSGLPEIPLAHLKESHVSENDVAVFKTYPEIPVAHVMDTVIHNGYGEKTYLQPLETERQRFDGYLYDNIKVDSLPNVRMSVHEVEIREGDGTCCFGFEFQIKVGDKTYTENRVSEHVALTYDQRFITFDELKEKGTTSLGDILGDKLPRNPFRNLLDFVNQVAPEDPDKKKLWSLFDEFARIFSADDRKEHIVKQRAIIEQNGQAESNQYKNTHSYQGINFPEGFSTDGQNLWFTEYKKEKKTVRDASGEESTTDEVVEVPHNIGNLCIITEIAINDDGVTDCKVVYETEYGTREMWVPKDALVYKDGLREMSRGGCIFPEDTLKYVKRYFSGILSAPLNEGIKRTYKTNICGWKDNFQTFVLGKWTISAVGRIYEFGDDDVAAYYAPHGTLERQVEGLNYLSDDPIVQFKYCAAAAAPLLSILGLTPFTIEHIGNSRDGKSLSSEHAVCLGANPIVTDVDSPILSGKFTESSIEEKWANQTNTLIDVDELSLFEKNKRSRNADDGDHKGIIYMFSEGKGKSRNDRGHKNHKEKTWSAIMVMNGENPLTEDSDNVGLMMRLLEINTPMITNKKGVDKFNEIIKMERNYAHILPLYLEELVTTGPEQIRQDFSQVLDIFTTEAGDSRTRQSMANKFAVLTLGGIYLNRIFAKIGVHTFDSYKVVKEIIQSYLDTNPDESMGKKAAIEYMSWFNANRNMFNEPYRNVNYIDDNTGNWTSGTEEEKKAYFGYYREGHIDHFTKHFKEVVDKLGYSPKKVLTEWEKDDIIVCDKGRCDISRKNNDDDRKASERYVRIIEEKMLAYIGIEVKPKKLVIKTANGIQFNTGK